MHEKAYHEKLASGEVQVHGRKTRKDAGQTRKRKWKPSKTTGGDSDDESESSGSSDEASAKKRRHSAKSAPIIDASDDED